MSEQAQSRDKTNGRWSREEHDKFMMGTLSFYFRTGALRQELEEDLGIGRYS